MGERPETDEGSKEGHNLAIRRIAAQNKKGKKHFRWVTVVERGRPVGESFSPSAKKANPH